jgi:hypothetical protein
MSDRLVDLGGRIPSALFAVLAILEDRLSSMVAAKLRRCAGDSSGSGSEPTIETDSG